MHAKDVALIGLAVDIAGAILLARSFMVKGALDIYDETGTRVGRNLAMVKSVMLQRAEAWGGAALLSIGFTLQIIAALEVSSGPALFVGWWSLLLLLAGFLALFVASYRLCGRIGKAHFYEWALRNYDGISLDAPDSPQKKQELLHLGRLYDLKPTKGESLDAFAASLSKHVAVLGERHRGKQSLPSDIEKKNAT